MIDDIIITLTEASLEKEKISSAQAEQWYSQLDALKKRISRNVRVTDEDRQRHLEEDEAKIRERQYNDGSFECEGCNQSMPGVIFPVAANGNGMVPWVHRCSECEIFESDLHAAFFLQRLLGYGVAMGFHTGGYSACPYIKGLSFDQADALIELIKLKHIELRTAWKGARHVEEGATEELRVYLACEGAHDAD